MERRFWNGKITLYKTIEFLDKWSTLGYSGPMTKKLPIKTYVDKDVYNFLKRLAKRQRCSVAQAVRTILTEVMNERRGR